MRSLQEFKNTMRSSGDLFLPPSIRRFLYNNIIGTNISLFYISYWSILHFISGILLSIIGVSYSTGLLIHTLWELWQKFIGMTVWNLRGGIDTIIDTLLCMLGMFIASFV